MLVARSAVPSREESLEFAVYDGPWYNAATSWDDRA